MNVVYALHDFVGENEDEITFYVGEAIYVIERDDLYNDGWWQGRSARDEVGLFPSNYVTVEKPLPVQPVPEQLGAEEDDNDLDIPPPTAFLNGHDSIYIDSSMPPLFIDAKMPMPPSMADDILRHHQQPPPQQQRSSVTEADGPHTATTSFTATATTTAVTMTTDGAGLRTSQSDLAFPSPPGVSTALAAAADADALQASKRTEVIQRPDVDSWHISGWSLPRDAPLEPIPELPVQFRNSQLSMHDTPAAATANAVQPTAVRLSAASSHATNDSATLPSEAWPTINSGNERPLSVPSDPTAAATTTSSHVLTSKLFINKGHVRSASQPLQPSTIIPAKMTPMTSKLHTTITADEAAEQEVKAREASQMSSTLQPPTAFRRTPESDQSTRSTHGDDEPHLHHPHLMASSRTSVASDSVGGGKSAGNSGDVLQHSANVVASAMQRASLHHTESTPAIDGLSEDYASWGVAEVAIWLERAGLSAVMPEFQRHEITGDVLGDLNITMLKELEISSFGRRYHVMQAISALRTGGVAASLTADGGANSRSARMGSPGHTGSVAMLNDAQYGSARGSVRSPSTASNSPALSRTSSTRQEMQAELVSRRSPQAHVMVMPPRRSPSRPVSTISFGSDSPIAAAVYNAGMSVHYSNTGHSAAAADATPAAEPAVYTAPAHISGPLEAHRHSPFAPRELHHYRRPSEASSNISHSASFQHHHQHHQHQQSVDQSGDVMARNPSIRATAQQGPPPPPPPPQPHSIPISPPTSTSPALARQMRYQQPSVAPAPVESANSSGNTRPDHQGWLRRQTLGPVKVWKRRWFLLKNGQLFSAKSPSAERIKPVITVPGCRVVADANVNPGYYGFRIVPSNKHPDRRVQLFCYDDEDATKNWIKCLLKSTIDRDLTAPVVSSCTVATVPLNVARDMQPRPPSVVFNNSPNSNKQQQHPQQHSPPPPSPQSVHWPQPSVSASIAYNHATVPRAAINPLLAKQGSSTSLQALNRMHSAVGLPSEQQYTPIERPNTTNSAIMHTAPVGQRVSGFMRNGQQQPVRNSTANGEHEEEEMRRKSKSRLSVISRLSRTMMDEQPQQQQQQQHRRTGSRNRMSGRGSAMSYHSRTPSTDSSFRLSVSERISQASQPPPPHHRPQHQRSLTNNSSLMMTGVPEEGMDRDLQHLAPRLLNWVNRYLAHSGHAAKDLAADLRSGFFLLRFLEELSGHDIGTVVPDARETGRPIEDMRLVFRVLQALGVSTHGYAPNDLLIGNEEKVVTMLLAVQHAFPSSVPADFYH